MGASKRRREGKMTRSEYFSPVRVGPYRSLPPKPMPDALLLRYVSGEDYWGPYERYESWLGWPIIRCTRRNAGDSEHVNDAREIIASAERRGVISRTKYFAPDGRIWKWRFVP